MLGLTFEDHGKVDHKLDDPEDAETTDHDFDGCTDASEGRNDIGDAVVFVGCLLDIEVNFDSRNESLV